MTRNLLRAMSVAAALAACSGLASGQDQAPPAQPGTPSQPAPTQPPTQPPVQTNGHQKIYHEPAPVDPNAPVGKIVFDSTTHDFGHIVDTEPVTCEFPFRNDGPGDLVINAVNSTCGCTVPELSKTVYKPGESGSITITFNPSGKRDAVTKRITVQSNDRDTPITTLQINTFIEQLVSIDPGVLTFGNLRKGEIQSRVLTVIGRTPDFALSEVAIIGNPGLAAEVIGTEDAVLSDGTKGRKIEIEITTDGTGKPGGLQGQFTAKTNDSRKPQINAAITGAIIGDVNLDVERLPIGVLAPGKSYERVIHVENRLGKPFAFLGAELKAPIGENLVNWDVLPAAEGANLGVDPAQRSSYDVKVTITAGLKTGALRGTLVFKTDVPDEETIEVPFWGTVRAPQK